MVVLFWALLCLALCAPGLRSAPRLVGLAALLYGLDVLAVVLPLGWWSQLGLGLQFNWTGKLLSIILALVVIYRLRLVSPAEVGLRWPVAGSWRVVGLVGLCFVALEFADGFSNRYHHAPPSLEKHLYELIMPGVAEELFDRGVFLGLLSRVFPRNIPFFGARTSWGGVVSVLLFVLSHALLFSGPLATLPQVNFSPGLVLDILLWGTLFLWVRERSGSVWAAVLVHNLANTALFLGHALP